MISLSEKPAALLLVVLALLESVSTQASSAGASQDHSRDDIPKVADVGGVRILNCPPDDILEAWEDEVEKYRKLCPLKATLTGLAQEADQLDCIALKMGLDPTEYSFIALLERLTSFNLQGYKQKAKQLGGDCENAIPNAFFSRRDQQRVFFLKCLLEEMYPSCLRYSLLGEECLWASWLLRLSQCAPTALMTQASLDRGLRVMTEAHNAVLRESNFAGLADCIDAWRDSQGVLIKAMESSGFLVIGGLNGNEVNSIAIQAAINASPNVGLPNIQTRCDQTDPYEYARCVGKALARLCGYYGFQVLAEALLPVGRR